MAADEPAQTFKQRGYTASCAAGTFLPHTDDCQEPTVSISHPHRPAPDENLQPESAVQRQPCFCAHCATDEFLVPETIHISRQPGRGETWGWDVSYWCSQCDRYYGHPTDELPLVWGPATT